MGALNTRLGRRLSVYDRERRGVTTRGNRDAQRLISAAVMARWVVSDAPPTAEDVAEWRRRPEWQQP